MTIGQRIKALRHERQLTQKQLADRLGMSKSALAMYETDQRFPKLDTLDAIADFFNIDMAFLLGKSDCRNVYQLTQSQATYDITPPEYEMVCAYRVADDDTKSIVDTALRRYKKPPASEDAGDDASTYQAAARSGDRVDVNRVSLEEELAALPPKRKRDI